jgi:RNA polymerase sigma-70 factor (ECF subfamily)
LTEGASTSPQEQGPSDALARVRAGEIEAYAEVVRAHQVSVWRVVALVVRDAALTHELVQQAFVEAYFALDRFEAHRDFGPWVRGIARNLARQELRRRGREARRYDAYREHLEAAHGEGDHADGHEQALLVALARCRDKLAEPARRALELRYEQALSFEHVARALGRTVAATRQLLQRVRLQLRSCIEEGGTP